MLVEDDAGGRAAARDSAIEGREWNVGDREEHAEAGGVNEFAGFGEGGDTAWPRDFVPGGELPFHHSWKNLPQRSQRRHREHRENRREKKLTAETQRTQRKKREKVKRVP